MQGEETTPEIEETPAGENTLEVEPEIDIGAGLRQLQAEMAGKDPEKVEEDPGAPTEETGKETPEETPEGTPKEPDKVSTEPLATAPPKEDFRARIARKAAEHKKKLAEQAKQIEELSKARPDEKASRLLQAAQAGNFAEVLQALGTDLPSFNEAILTGKAPVREPTVQEQVQAALAEQEKQRQAVMDAQIAQAKRGIASQVVAHPEADLIRDLGLGDRVAEVVISELAQGREVSVDQAVKEVEAYLVQRIEAKKKGKAPGAPAAPKATPAAPKTLTSKTAPNSAGKPARKSARQREEDAAQWLREQRLRQASEE